MKVLGAVLAQFSLQVKPLQFTHQSFVGVDDAFIYLLFQHSHSQVEGGIVRIMFFYFYSAFNTIQPLLQSGKLVRMSALLLSPGSLSVWLVGSLCVVVVSNTGALQCYHHSYLPCTPQISSITMKRESSDDTAVVGCDSHVELELSVRVETICTLDHYGRCQISPQ